MHARSWSVAALAVSAAGAALATGAAVAAAMPLPAAGAGRSVADHLVLAAEVRVYKRNNRYRYRRDFLEFGYYEKFPAYEYTTEPSAALLNPDGAHAQWCFSQYQSYDLATDTYLAGNGSRKPCLDPE